ncbi:uncharacterized protein LOC110724254 [Chenopodium quinoa]|uniref:uncharacterized protein LOC110724254 n=1 Tax=Chenopodium quinoa TaxID=63459 RepID=UPI000B76EF7D|nr:uncharacterized protein LOC110724254 [Chenopodium quinoa]
MADQVLALLTPRLVSLVEGIVGRALGSSSKAGYLDMYTVSIDKGSQPRLSGSSNKGAKKLKAPQEKNPIEQKESCNSSNGEIGDTMTRETAFDKRLETFVKGWKDLKDEKQEGSSIIECDGMNATQRDCYGVVGPRAHLGHQYVRMTSILYTKYWGTLEFLNWRKRILIDPSYAMMIKAKEKDYANLARKLLLSIRNDDIRLVFFLWMIDSLYPDPYEQHSELVSELVKAIDVLFQLNDPFWELGTCEKWPKHVVGMVKQTDTFSCGVLMLGCIKHCARNGPDTSYSLEKNLKKRLFLEDANNSCNELLAKFDEILPKDRVRPRRTLSSQNTL